MASSRANCDEARCRPSTSCCRATSSARARVGDCTGDAAPGEAAVGEAREARGCRAGEYVVWTRKVTRIAAGGSSAAARTGGGGCSVKRYSYSPGADQSGFSRSRSDDDEAESAPSSARRSALAASSPTSELVACASFHRACA
eukprot:scaffold91466_cov75-Phaeocystis_antarctica.AAC.2